MGSRGARGHSWGSSSFTPQRRFTPHTPHTPPLLSYPVYPVYPRGGDIPHIPPCYAYTPYTPLLWTYPVYPVYPIYPVYPVSPDAGADFPPRAADRISSQLSSAKPIATSNADSPSRADRAGQSQRSSHTQLIHKRLVAERHERGSTTTRGHFLLSTPGNGLARWWIRERRIRGKRVTHRTTWPASKQASKQVQAGDVPACLLHVPAR